MGIYKSNLHFEVSERVLFLRIFDLFFVFSTIFITAPLLHNRYLIEVTQSGVAILILGFYILLFGGIMEVYDLYVASKEDKILVRGFIQSVLVCIFYLFTPILTPAFPENRESVFILFVVISLPLLMWREIYVKLFVGKYVFVKKIILICRGSRVNAIENDLKHSDPHLLIVAYFDTDGAKPNDTNITRIGNSHTLRSYITRLGIYQIIVSPGVDATFLDSLLLECLENGIQVSSLVNVIESDLSKIPIELMTDDFYSHFPFSRSNYNRLYLAFGRISDVMFSICGLICLLVLLPAILLGNILANRGPLLYRQERIGRYGRPFKIIKLRSMIVSAEDNGAQFAKKEDPRVTKFGAFLRKTRLDELPQLVNILKGEMSVIGPRPERKVFVDQITKATPFYPIRHAVKPGLTGWAQVNYRYGTSVRDSVEKLKYDLYYIKHRGLLLDAKVFLKTISSVLFMRGQ